ncbi:hypothetical protein [Miniphocaeibacter massiliensis]|uniref:hypothetical protein n=1 Tax=Miniphocaeibacter massiliensis TaxID=2041841 RepID=UPI000C1C657A|nr:hypothetical protein [Miniphocaeibacter massiliensis]
MSKEKLLKEIKKDAESLISSINELLIEIDKQQGVTPEIDGQISIEEHLKQKSITLEDVRRVLADKSRAGYTEKIRELLQKYGAKKLSQIDEKHFSALLKDAEDLR